MNGSHSVGKQVSFSELFDEFAVVEIPIIQRDYAQGRDGQEELRREFLTALKSAIERPADDPAVPLDLDFVYGSAFGTSTSPGTLAFSPLDGQQRLTTLFLLHWYLAWTDGATSDFQGRFMTNSRSRLSYQVRPSSHDFFNAIGSNFPADVPSGLESIDGLIRDRPWFFQAWKNDPTILSALTVLNEIHTLFQGCNGFYARLIDVDSPRVTFQLLELRDFGLSDDLYIKMNARGKPLTPFETFKARIEQHLDELLPDDYRPFAGSTLPVGQYFGHRMDTAWSDLFWEHRDPQTNLFDSNVMQLVKAVALVCLDPDAERASKTVIDLRAAGPTISFTKLHSLGCLNAKMLNTLIAILDHWSMDPPKADTGTSYVYNGNVAFEQATAGGLTYPELIKFAGFCSFINSHKLPINGAACDSWLRVLTNLVNNSDIERPADFLDALKSVNAINAHSDEILAYLAENGEVAAFSRQQIREERVKATLVLRSPEWQQLIAVAEQHEYFEGQIEFLLDFSGILEDWLKTSQIDWTAAEEEAARTRFGLYFSKAHAVFNANGLRSFVEYSWERALLTFGDYTLSHGKNKSLLQNKSYSSDRRPTWKQLLRGHLSEPDFRVKRDVVKLVLDRVNVHQGVQQSLDRTIDAAQITEPWRQMMVRLPRAIEYCGQRMFRIQDNGAVYLISKLRTSSEHVELRSYFLYQTTLIKMRADGKLRPFNLFYEPASDDDYIPSAVLTWRDSRIEIDYAYRFRVAFKVSTSESHQFLLAEIGRALTVESIPGWNVVSVSDDEIHNVIESVVSAASLFDKTVNGDKS